MIKGYLFSVLYALICLALAFVVYKLGVPKKITRKIVHILVGFEWVILYNFMGPTVHFLAVCLLFTLILWITNRNSLLPMISSDGDNSPGTVYYGVAMSVMALITFFVHDMILPFGIGVFCTSFGDGLAGLFGQSITAGWNKKIYNNKSLVGAFVNFISCFGVTAFFSSHFDLGLSWLNCLAVAVLSLELELFTGKGLDNITITLGTALLSYAFINFSSTANYIIPILLTPVIIVFAKKKKALTAGGIIAALVIDVIISVFLGNFGFCILLAFFAGGVAVDKIKKKLKKKTSREVEKRSDCRDHVQVLVNSIVAVICALLYGIFREKVFIVAFVSSLAEAFADTASSGIGIIRGKAFDLFRMKPCYPGLSGGMSIPGTLAALLGAILISVLAFTFGRITLTEAAIIALAAFLGSVFDSMLGSLVQVKFKCKRCGLILEREEHCKEKAERYSGIKFVNNDIVNLLGTLFAATLAAVIYSFSYLPSA